MQTDEPNTVSNALVGMETAGISDLPTISSSRQRKISNLTRAHSALGMINIALSNESGQPDLVEIDKADDEEDLPISPLVSLNMRPGMAKHTPTPEDTPARCPPNSIVGGVKHKPIAERIIRRRNSENAFQVVMQVAQTRKETLAKLLDEHQELVREIDKWSSIASLQSNPAAPGAATATGNTTTSEPLGSEADSRDQQQQQQTTTDQ